MILVGQTFYAYATNSVAGNIQIIASDDRTHWTAIGNALPNLPAWATPDYTWAPSVASIGGSYLLYYAVDVAGTGKECISVATAGRPQGPYTDRSTAPLECQKSSGDDRPGVVRRQQRNALPDLEVRGPGLLQNLVAGTGSVGHVVRRGDESQALLVPDESWEAGTVEAPDMVVTTGGHYSLFFSGNDWDSANYAVGMATCTGPSGPCSDASRSHIGERAGCGGSGRRVGLRRRLRELSVRVPRLGPRRGGFPNSRDLYIRPLTFSDTGVTVAASDPVSG